MSTLEIIAKFFTVVPDPMLLVDSQGSIVLANAHVYSLFGYKADGLTGKPVACLLPERYRATHGKQLDSYFRSPTVRAEGMGMEFSASRADGSEFPVEISLSPYLGENTVMVLVAVRDISERRHLEEARRESESQKEIAEERRLAAQVLADRNASLIALFDATPMGIITTKEGGAIDRWNLTAQQIFGYTASEVIGTNVAELSDALRADGEHVSMFSLSSQGKEVRNLPARSRRRDGRVVDINISATRFFDVSGEMSGFVFLVDDVTERNAIDQQLRQSQKMEAIGQLTGGVAHDFNNLLTIILSNLELIDENLPPDSELKEMIQEALGSVTRGANLIRRLLAYARQQPLEPKVLNISDLVSGITELLRRSLGETIKIQIVLPEGLWRTRVDPSQLENALLNLAVNARDAMPNGGKLTIEGENVVLDAAYAGHNAEVSAGEYVLLAVTDTGTGMPKEVIEHALEPFFTTKAVGKGSGLGLSMVYGFVKQSGGHVKIYSEAGHGTTMKLYLPRAEGPVAVSTSVHDPSPHPRSLTGETILLVEDDATIRKLVSRLLQGLGYQVMEAEDAPSALIALAEGRHLDMLFTDVVLPNGMNGADLARQAQTQFPHLKVLYMSGYTKNSLVFNGSQDENVHLLTKPFRKDDLARAVRRVLDNGDNHG